VIRDTGGIDTLDFSRSTSGITLDLGMSNGQTQSLSPGGRKLTLTGTFEHVIGSAFADQISGNDRPNRIEGRGGDDDLDGGGGRQRDRRAGAGCDGDTILGGTGRDSLDGGRGRDWLDGGPGDDSMTGDSRRDTLDGGAGVNTTIAVTKGDGACSSATGAANAGPALRDGVLRVRGGESADRIQIDFVGSNAVLVVNGQSHEFPIADVSSILVRVGGGNDRVDLGSSVTVPAVLRGGAGDDTLTGGSGGDVLRGGQGDDLLTGGFGADVLGGGPGRDSLEGGRDADTLRGGAGIDIFEHLDAADLFAGGAGLDQFDGTIEPTEHSAWSELADVLAATAQ